MRNKQFAKFILTALTILTAALMVNAQPGSLDPTFGSGGINLTYVPTTDVNMYMVLEKSAIQSDGKLLGLYDAPRVEGKDVVVRYNADGTLDTGFAGGGLLYVDWNIPNYTQPGYAHAIAVQTVGGEEKILVAGSSSSTTVQTGLRVDRYNADGSFDASFGSGGSVNINAGYARTIAVQPDGKILSYGPSGDLIRLNIDGTLDTTFGIGGIARTSAPTNSSLAVQSTGRILVLGYTSSKNRDFLTVKRYNANGSPDDGSRKDSTPNDSFGTGGATTIEFYSGGSARTILYSSNNLVIDANGKILALGFAQPKSSSVTDFAVARLTANGQFDTTFDGDGKAAFDFTPHDFAKSLALQSDGKIVLVGNVDNAAGQPDLGMIRLNPNGSLDAAFGSGGIVTGFPLPVDSFQGMIQSDPICACEKIAVIGKTYVGEVPYSAAARYLE